MADRVAVSITESDLLQFEQHAADCERQNARAAIGVAQYRELIRLARMGLKFEGKIDTLTGRLLIVKQKIDAELEDLKALFGEGGAGG
jgi:hypothetical protein